MVMSDMSRQDLLKALNEALAWELRAIALYSHYSAYVSGIHRIHLSTHFNNEVNESLLHASTVRSAIVKLDGVATTERDIAEIVHTSNYKEMLLEAYETEKRAVETYSQILPLVEKIGDSELYDSLEVVFFDEQRSVEELRMMLKDQ